MADTKLQHYKVWVNLCVCTQTKQYTHITPVIQKGLWASRLKTINLLMFTSSYLEATMMRQQVSRSYMRPVWKSWISPTSDGTLCMKNSSKWLPVKVLVTKRIGKTCDMKCWWFLHIVLVKYWIFTCVSEYTRCLCCLASVRATQWKYV